MSEIVVELVLVCQIDPTKDECSQSQSEHHNENCRACMAVVLKRARSRREGSSAGLSGALLAALLATTLPGAEGTTGTGTGTGAGAGWCWGPL